MSASPRWIVVAGPGDVAAAACRLVLDAEREALARSGTFRIALSGGSTPRRLYELLSSSDEATFASWRVFFGDERWVPADHPDSNFRMACEALLDHVPIPSHQVHRIDTSSGSPEKAAYLYSMTLRRGLAPDPGETPRFDLVLLGLGSDGHTASLFPGSSALAAAPGEIAVATWVTAQSAWRVTLTAQVLCAARAVVFLVSGRDKAPALRRVREGSAGAPPASLVRPTDGTLTFVVDEAAAVQIEA
ncbi:MAG: 6-phosphogluconolactonase [Candidatus Binatia bacterium]